MKAKKNSMPPALKAYWAKKRRQKGNLRGRRRRTKAKVTVTTSRTVRRTNPRLSVLYAVKGRDRLKYLGGIKFAKKGRAHLFRTPMAAHAMGKLLKGCFRQALKGFNLEVKGA